MKTIRLLYPDHVSGGLDTYYFGARLLAHILPDNPAQPLVEVQVAPPDGKEKEVTGGIRAEAEVLSGIRDARAKITESNPDKIITIGGNCLVSLAPFDYLRGKYQNTGVIWVDAHPDVSGVEDGYPNAHAMVLGSMMGHCAPQLVAEVQHGFFRADEILYVGLQPLHTYQSKFLDDMGVVYRIQDQSFLSNDEIGAFMKRFDHILVHFDVDVMDEHLFHSTYFANPDLKGDGSGGGKMSMEKLSEILRFITEESDVVGFTIAEYLPFDEHKLHQMFSGIRLFTENRELSPSS